MRNFEKVCKWLFSKKEDLSYMKYRYRIIGKLIFIKVLWKLFHPNTPIKSKLWTSLIIILYTSTFFIIIFMIFLSIYQVVFCQSLIWGLGQSFAKTFTIEPVTLANLLMYFCHWASTLASLMICLKDKFLSDLCYQASTLANLMTCWK